MNKKILVIGGTRLFGRHLVHSLVGQGHDVTIATRGIAADDFGDTVQRIQVDRRNSDAMRAAFAGIAGFDLVYDQMCYNPLDARISTETFTGKVTRYVMASTIEVYRHLVGVNSGVFTETAIDLAQQKIDLDFDWYDPAIADQSYAEGKRQAEAYFLQHSSLPVVAVRIGHVLAGP